MQLVSDRSELTAVALPSKWHHLGLDYGHVRGSDRPAGSTPVSTRCLAAVSGELQVLLPIEGLVDLDALHGRLEKDIAKAEKEIKGLAGRLANHNFAGKAPPEVVAECQANLAEAEAQAALARQRLADLD